MQLIRFFLGLSILIYTAYCSKFLAVAYNSRSHYFAMKKIAEELAQRDHEVILLAFEKKDQRSTTHKNVKIMTCAGIDNIGLHENLSLQLLKNKTGFTETIRIVSNMNVRMCECILNDDVLMREFKTCDVMISDLMLLCASVLRDLLNIPRVTFYCGLITPTIHSWIHGIPIPISYIPHFATGLSTKMNFFQRVGNVIHFSLFSVCLYYYIWTTGNYIKVKYNITPERDYWESVSHDSHLVIIQTDFAINYARPLPPAKPKKNLPQNIKTLPWIPQNDILGHVSTKAFVTHLGHNGMFEAAYHKVPMVGAPLLYDQFDNAEMMKAAGLGISVDIRSISADELTAAIERVIQEPSFKSNAVRVSRLIKDRRRTPVQEAADHMEYVLRHGGAKHLRPAVLDIPWYQYFLLDVIAFLVAMATIVLTILVYLVRCIFRCFSRKILKMKTA